MWDFHVQYVYVRKSLYNRVTECRLSHPLVFGVNCLFTSTKFSVSEHSLRSLIEAPLTKFSLSRESAAPRVTAGPYSKNILVRTKNVI